MKRGLLFGFLATLLSTTVFAQSPTGLGRSPYGAYFSTDIDTVNLYNGNVMLDIPLFSRQGRETSSALRLTYNAQGWSDGSTSYGSYGYYLGGWHVANPVGQGANVYPYLTDCDYTNWPWVDPTGIWTIYVEWVDATGAGHTYDNAIISNPPATGGCDSFSWAPLNSMGGQWLSPTNSADTSLALLGTDGLLTVHFENGQSALSTGRLETLNGNYADLNYGSMLDDTLGRTLGYSWNAGVTNQHNTRYTVYDSAGNPQTYQLNYEDCHSAYNPIEAHSDCIDNVLTSITLPNGDSYQFQYGHDQGFLTKITLPSGGYIEYDYSGGNTDHNVDHNYIVERRVSADGSTTVRWTYARSASGSNRVVTVTDPDDHQVVHTFDTNGSETEAIWRANATASPSKTVQTTRSGYRPATVVTKVGDVEQTQTFSWGGLHLLNSTQSDWYPANGTVVPLTKTNYEYYIGCSVTPCNLNFPTKIELQQWNGSSYVTQGKTEFVYNEYSLASTSGSVPHHHTPIFPRWNVTTIKRYYDASNYVSEHFHYDDTGNIVEHVDPRGKSTVFSYADHFSDSTNRYTFAYPTMVTNAEGHEIETVYNFDTGLPTTVINARNLATTFTYDPMDRPLSATEPNGRMVSYAYTDASTPKVVEQATVASGQVRKTETTFDKLYRPIQTKQYDPAGNVFVDTEYDAYGRPKKVSAPYRSGPPLWTQTAYDELGRPLTITNPDSTSVQFTYDDNTATITDEAGNARRETSNALGQLTQVEEPNPTLSTPLATTYSYSMSGSLAGVTQGSQTRSFTTDWLGRLTQEAHPETGTTSYGYDSGGLLTSRTDARSVTTTYTYDDIGRLLTTSYNDSLTPTVTRTYDQNGYLGLPTSIADGIGSTTLTYKSDSNFLASESRTFSGVSGTFTSSYNYDLEGKPTSITYPSGRQVSRSYAAGSGVTAGQLASITDGATSTTVLDGVSDNPAGQILGQTLGNGAAETRVFNSRLQLSSIGASKSSAPLMDLAYGYGASNNGRIRSRTDNLQPEQSVGYSYDPLQRLSQVNAINSNWSITWGFDRYGNRTSQTPSGLAYGRVGSQTIGYSGNKNTSWSYDNAGNVTHDGTGGHYYTFDGENRIVQIDSSANQYAYDGDGRRVAKLANSVTTYYVYGLTGLMSEFTTANTGATAAANTDRLEYRMDEQTGTAVLLMNSSGLVVENNRVFPYGELWSIPAASTNEENFTTYSRDGESGLDYAMARYFASRSGRFMSADPGHVGTSLGDPQSWNPYSYAINDPINFTDPSGLCPPESQSIEDCPNGGSMTVNVHARCGFFCRLFGGGGTSGGGSSVGLGPCFDVARAGDCTPAGTQGSSIQAHPQIEPTVVPRGPQIGVPHGPVSQCVFEGALDGVLDLTNLSLLPGASQDNWRWNPDTIGFDYESTPTNILATSLNTGLFVSETEAKFVKNNPPVNRMIGGVLRSIGSQISYMQISKRASLIAKAAGRFAKALAVKSAYDRYQKCRGY